MSLPSRRPIPFDRPAAYQIVVQGQIDPSMSDLLAGMTIQNIKDETGALVTMLNGESRNQGSLAGVLNSIYELHLTVISVERLNEGLPANPA